MNQRTNHLVLRTGGPFWHHSFLQSAYYSPCIANRRTILAPLISPISVLLTLYCEQEDHFGTTHFSNQRTTHLVLRTGGPIWHHSFLQSAYYSPCIAKRRTNLAPLISPISVLLTFNCEQEGHFGTTHFSNQRTTHLVLRTGGPFWHHSFLQSAYYSSCIANRWTILAPLISPISVLLTLYCEQEDQFGTIHFSNQRTTHLVLRKGGPFWHHSFLQSAYYSPCIANRRTILAPLIFPISVLLTLYCEQEDHFGTTHFSNQLTTQLVLRTGGPIWHHSFLQSAYYSPCIANRRNNLAPLISPISVLLTLYCEQEDQFGTTHFSNQRTTHLVLQTGGPIWHHSFLQSAYYSPCIANRRTNLATLISPISVLLTLYCEQEDQFGTTYFSNQCITHLVLRTGGQFWHHSFLQSAYYSPCIANRRTNLAPLISPISVLLTLYCEQEDQFGTTHFSNQHITHFVLRTGGPIWHHSFLQSAYYSHCIANMRTNLAPLISPISVLLTLYCEQEDQFCTTHFSNQRITHLVLRTGGPIRLHSFLQSAYYSPCIANRRTNLAPLISPISVLLTLYCDQEDQFGTTHFSNQHINHLVLRTGGPIWHHSFLQSAYYSPCIANRRTNLAPLISPISV